MHCDYGREVAGVMHCCEREANHEGEHVFAFTSGQLHALHYRLRNPKVARFPFEAILLIFAAVGVEVFTNHHSALDWAASFIMVITAIRWLRQWQDERKL